MQLKRQNPGILNPRTASIGRAVADGIQTPASRRVYRTSFPGSLGSVGLSYLKNIAFRLFVIVRPKLQVRAKAVCITRSWLPTASRLLGKPRHTHTDRQRKRERVRRTDRCVNTHTEIYTYIYIYIHICIPIYMCVYTDTYTDICYTCAIKPEG